MLYIALVSLALVPLGVLGLFAIVLLIEALYRFAWRDYTLVTLHNNELISKGNMLARIEEARNHFARNRAYFEWPTDPKEMAQRREQRVNERAGLRGSVEVYKTTAILGRLVAKLSGWMVDYVDCKSVWGVSLGFAVMVGILFAMGITGIAILAAWGMPIHMTLPELVNALIVLSVIGVVCGFPWILRFVVDLIKSLKFNVRSGEAERINELEEKVRLLTAKEED